MEQTGPEIGNLPYELAQISQQARKYLKTLAASLIQYHKDLPARDLEALSREKESDEALPD
jgi:hypothetical protein